MKRMDILATEFTSAGQRQSGSLIRVGMKLDSGGDASLSFPYQLSAQLQVALNTGGQLAAAERTKAFGNIPDTALGMKAILVEQCEVRQSWNPAANRYDILLRAKIGDRQFLDIGLSPEVAEDMGKTLQSAAQQAASLPRPAQN